MLQIIRLKNTKKNIIFFPLSVIKSPFVLFVCSVQFFFFFYVCPSFADRLLLYSVHTSILIIGGGTLGFFSFGRIPCGGHAARAARTFCLPVCTDTHAGHAWNGWINPKTDQRARTRPCHSLFFFNLFFYFILFYSPFGPQLP